MRGLLTPGSPSTVNPGWGAAGAEDGVRGLQTSDQLSSEGAGQRLNSWKEIAAFFGKDERTVKRWETIRGLPVRRVPGGTRTSVFAYVGELEAWLSAPRPAVAQARPIEPAAPAAAEPSSQHLTLPIAAAVLIVTAIVLGFIAIATPPRAPGPTPVPPQAQVLYDEGVIAWTGRTAAGFATAIEKFDAALALAPDFARAEVGLANAYNLISQYTMAPPAESYAKARAAAERAIALDPQLAEAYAALGFNAFYGSHDFAGSARLFDKSLALKPDNAQALHWYALTSMQLGKFERPLELIDHALALQPESRSIRANAALIHYYSGETTTAIEMLEQLRQANPDYLAVPSYLATIYLDQRRYAQFLDNYEIAANVEGSVGRQLIAKAARAALPNGGIAMLQAMLEEQKHQFQAERESAYKVAATAALLGDKATALSYLETSVERRETIGLLVEPEFRTLRDEPRFVALLNRLGLPTS